VEDDSTRREFIKSVGIVIGSLVMAHIHYHRGQFVAVFVAMATRLNLAELLPTPDEMRQALAVADAAAAEFHFPISCSIALQPCLIDLSAYANLGFGFCAADTKRAYYTLDPLGNLRPCNHTTTILGNLLEEPFADLVSPERMCEFVEAVPAFCGPCALPARAAARPPRRSATVH